MANDPNDTPHDPNDPQPSRPAPLDADDFEAQHNALAAKQQAQGPANLGPRTSPGPAEAQDATTAATLLARATDLERQAAQLKADAARAQVQEYPKVLYHTDHENPDAQKARVPVTVHNKQEEDDARGHGWTHANPGEATKARRGSKTPDATEHTREDENARRDLPAQMALDQDARTGKPPIDSVVDSDAPDPGAPRAGQAGTTVAQSPQDAQRSARQATEAVKNATRDDQSTTRRGGNR